MLCRFYHVLPDDWGPSMASLPKVSCVLLCFWGGFEILSPWLWGGCTGPLPSLSKIPLGQGCNSQAVFVRHTHVPLVAHLHLHPSLLPYIPGSPAGSKLPLPEFIFSSPLCLLGRMGLWEKAGSQPGVELPPAPRGLSASLWGSRTKRGQGRQ